jgi:lipoprotein-anchoring transpeptidase ErfK/SrfK
MTRAECTRIVRRARDQSSVGRAGRFSVTIAAASGALLLLLPAAATASRDGAAGAASSATATRAFPYRYLLTDAKVGHWSVVLATVAAHREPSASAPVVTTLSPVTGDGTQNVVLIVGGIDVSPSQTWYEVRLAILPNNSTGWVPRSALGNVYAVHTHLYVDRATFTATLKRDGRTIFRTKVGVGHSYWPTPAGQFYIRDKLSGFNDSFYGPLAFGTSARSAVLTDWPGGGYIGVHGTNAPQILPGSVSHGCIRMRNDAIVRLARLMDVGTPLTIT